VGGIFELGRVLLLDGLAKFRQCARAILYEEGRNFPQQLHISADAG